MLGGGGGLRKIWRSGSLLPAEQAEQAVHMARIATTPKFGQKVDNQAATLKNIEGI